MTANGWMLKLIKIKGDRDMRRMNWHHINLFDNWEAISTVAWFMFGRHTLGDVNTARTCDIHSRLIDALESSGDKQ